LIAVARRLLLPGLITLALFALAMGLGIWQVQRLAWKTALLADMDRAEASPAIDLPPDANAVSAAFQKVRLSGRLLDRSVLYGADVRDTPAGARMGGRLIKPLQRADGSIVLVDFGWLPDPGSPPFRSPISAGPAQVEGYLRPGDTAKWWSAKDDPAAMRFFTADPAAIGAALGMANVAPYLLVVMGPDQPGHFPIPAQHLPRPPNDHLSYAITWFSLGAILLVIFVLWSRKAIRK
jgi:surfeit locus 1 family protein